MNGNYSVEDICSTKNVKLIRECIDRYPEYADLFLERSCKHGILKMVKYLVEEHHISINKTRKGGESTHLCHAVQNNHFDITKYLLSKGANIHVDDSLPIRWAASHNKLDMLKLLVEHGANLETNNGYPILISIQFGFYHIADYLIEKGASIHSPSCFGACCEKGNLEGLKYLIEKGFDVNTISINSLRLACAYGHLHILKYLLDTLMVSLFDLSLLLCACRSTKSNIPVITYLLDKGLDVNDQVAFNNSCNYCINNAKFLIERGTTANKNEALDYVCQNGIVKSIKWLLANFDIDLHYQNNNALKLAINHGNLYIIKFLIEKGADINIGFLYSCKFAKTNRDNIIKYIISNNPDLFYNDGEALMNASIAGDGKLVEYLIDHGLTPYIDDAFTNACESGHFQIVKYLFNKGAQINTLINNANPLVLSCQNGFLNIVEFLIENNADIHICNDNAILTATRNGHLKIVKYLIRSGMNLQSLNDVLLEACVDNNHFEILKYLICQGVDLHFSDDKIIYSIACQGNLEMFKYVERLGLNIHTFDDASIVNACISGNFELIQYLEKKDCNIFAHDNMAFVYLAQFGYLDIIQYFVEKGVDLHFQDDRPLRAAAETGQLNVVKYLVNIGLDINADSGYCIKKASQNNHIEVLKYLIENGADPSHVKNPFVRDNVGLPKWLPKPDHLDVRNREECPISGTRLDNNVRQLVCSSCRNAYELSSLETWLKIQYKCPFCNSSDEFYLI